MSVSVDIQGILAEHDFVLTEAAVIEQLRRTDGVHLHPRLENSLLIYSEAGRKALVALYRSFVDVARKAGVPILLCAPTWRANRERLSAAGVTGNVNADAVRFLRHLQEAWGAWADKILVGGVIGCRNDCYRPDEGLPEGEAEAFHRGQIADLARAGVDFLLAATLPALPEATGMARAMAETDVPYVISFVIDRQGRILDGTSLERAVAAIDERAARPPIGYMVNCSHPSFLDAPNQPRSVFSRLIGYQANASSFDHAQLDGAGDLQADDLAEWGNLMIELNRTYGVKILGGCCGTSDRHLQYIVQHWRDALAG